MKRVLPTMLLVACGVMLAYGIIRLLSLRFELGDVYPEYSSLRSDPLGAMVLYESLSNIDQFDARRDFSTANRLPAANGTTYLHIATTVSAWQSVTNESFREIERFIREGGRLVITVHPRATLPRPVESKDPQIQEELERQRTDAPSLWSRWNLKPEFVSLDLSPDGVYMPATVVSRSGLGLPSNLEWHSALVFYPGDDAWQPIYTRENQPVMVERHAGQGSVVIATDSYFLSNEAMLRDRHTDLLSWLLGPNTNIVFDEAHLGVVENPGVANLMRRYRLQWFVGALILLCALFIWKNAVSLVPPHFENGYSSHVAGRDSFAGFVNLLRRAVPTGNILAIAHAEWKRSAAQTGRYSADRLRRAENAFQEENSRSAKDRDPVRAYTTIARILQRHNT
jgi:hypothetical protein